MTNENTAATADAFLSEIDTEPKRETLPKFGFFYVQVMTSAERTHAFESQDQTIRRIRLIATCILDQSKQPLFTEEQAAVLVGKRSNTAEQLAGLAIKHNTAIEDDAAKND